MPSPQISEAIERYKARPAGPPPSIQQLRARFAPGGKPFALPADVAVEPVLAGGVPAHWIIAPHVDAKRAVLYLHGGGYQLGDLRSHGELAARIGRAANARVLFIHYRMAPEHPYPAALDDALAAYCWLDRPVALVGDSAGGGLAIALMVALREARAPMPTACAVMSPWVDLTLAGKSLTDRAKLDPVLAPELVKHLAPAYLGDANPRAASPLFADLSKLPRLLIQVGSAEILFSDADRLAGAARAAGVDVTYEIGDGLTHVFQSIGDAPEAIAATDRLGAFLK